jgi:hypothetical protein
MDAAGDFNGQPEDLTYRGAYHGEGANPGWRLDDGLKHLPSADAPSPESGGTQDDEDGASHVAGVGCAATRTDVLVLVITGVALASRRASSWRVRGHT